MTKLLDYLKGKKTFLVALAIALLTLAKQMQWLDDNSYTTLLGLLGAGGLASLRAGMSKDHTF